MGQFFDKLTDDQITFIGQQPMYFVASATADGRVNLSPKGLDSFRVLSPREVGYLDLTGSGNETAAHLEHDGRITLMFCSFAVKPLILRIYGRGEVIGPADAAWDQQHERFPALPGQRQIILIQIQSVQTSCGFGVPMMQMQEQRSTLIDWAAKRGPDGMAEYQRTRNAKSIDGLPTHRLHPREPQH